MGPFDGLTPAQRMQIRQAHAAAKTRRADLTSGRAERGTCRTCGGNYEITKKGLIRSHGAKDGSWPPRTCDGAGQPPKTEEDAR